MARWDRIYLERVKKAGMKMRMYDRYVDDSNQAAEVPLPCSKYNIQTGKLYLDGNQNPDEPDEERTTRVLKEIADSVQPGNIIMETDHPSRNQDGKLPILDMKVWLDTNSFAVYQHYQKPMANRQIIDVKSALSSGCKKSVHINEVVRRVLNTSPRLKWSDYAAPEITDYMLRMKVAGYEEAYRKRTLQKALAIHDRMKKEESEGLRPMNRPRDWQAEERMRSKRKKKHNWATRGGFIAPIIIPPTPNSELLSMLKDVAEKEALPGMKFKIVESGGKTIQRAVQRSNPTASGCCQRGDCVACTGASEGTGSCRKSNVVYEFSCQLCPENQQAVYIGETACNLYTRGKEQKRIYDKMQAESFMHRHQGNKHHDIEANFEAQAKMTFKDCLTRQIAEGVAIRRCDKEILNTKSEWHQPALCQVRSEDKWVWHSYPEQKKKK
jgi:hypothetical protein